MKKITETIVTKYEVESALTPHAGIVLVYVRANGFPEATQVHVMREGDYEKVTKISDVQSMRASFPHSKEEYRDATYYAVSPELQEYYLTGRSDYRKKSSELKFGEPLPDGWVIWAINRGDNTLMDAYGKYINKGYRDFILNRDYDIYRLHADIESGVVKDIAEDHGDYDRGIYYVPGNGDTLNIRVIITDVQYVKFIKNDLFTRMSWINKNTSLGKYRRPKPLREDDD